mgnify:CR=1 FL=1
MGKRKKQLSAGFSFDRKQLLPYLAAIVLVLAAGVICEYLCNMKVLSLNRTERGIIPVGEENVAAEGFTKTAKGWELTEDKGILTVSLDGQYIHKIAYSYEYDHLLNARAYVCYYNEYGEADPEQDLILEDRNSYLLSTSYLNIGRETDHIQLVFEKNQLGEDGSREEAAKKPLVITEFEIHNTAVFNWIRLGFFWVIFGLATFFYLFRKAIGRHLEIGFTVACLSIGILMIAALPVSKVGYDEETHLLRSMEIASMPWGMNVSPGAWAKMIPSLSDWPENQPGSREEKALIEEFFNREGDYKNGNIHPDFTTPVISVPAYAGPALVLKVCKGLGIPFGIMIRLGRLGNLLVYAAVMFFAIKKTPVGKAVMAVIGLFPTSIFMACVYSYDPAVTAWIYLSMACLLKEILTPETKISWKSYGLILAAFVLGCSAKAVYAPMILIGLLLPASKFQDKRQEAAMRLGFILVLLGLLSTFVLPVLFAPKATGDLRGGDTSEVGQMSYVLGNFIAYIRILFRNIFHQLPDFVLGKDIFSVQGHLAAGGFTWLTSALVVYTVTTDTKTTAPERLSIWQKLWIFLMLGGAVLLVWTSMYISYTVPGMVTIAGVQGRYYMPILFLFYMLFNSRAIIARIENMWYHTGVLAVSSFILLATMWQTVIAACCL